MEDESKIWRKLHQHPLVAENRSAMCCVQGEKCRGYGTVRSCNACGFYVCQVCWDRSRDEVLEAEKARDKTRRGLDNGKVGEEDIADLLHALADLDHLDDGAMSGSDDGGDHGAAVDADEDDETLQQKFSGAKQLQLEQMKRSLYGGSGGPGGGGCGGLFGDEDEDGEEE